MNDEMGMMEMEMVHQNAFYSSKSVTILFQKWITSTYVGYTMSLFAIVIFGI